MVEAENKTGKPLASWWTRLCLALLFAGVLASIPYRWIGEAGARPTSGLEAELELTNQAIEQLRLDNGNLRTQIDALKNDPRAVEEIARDELGMVRPGDLIIRVDTVQPSAKAQP